MKEYAKKFYNSQAWRRTRAYILERDMRLCVRCGKPGDIVHHKIYITPNNIGDPDITLSADNLETLCRDCHAAEHEGTSPTAPGLTFTDDGELIPVESEGHYA